MNELLSHRDFRLLFAGQAASTVGDRITLVALALYVSEIGSPTDVGIVLAAYTLPLVAFLLIGGVWADRLPRHMVMVSTDLVRAALQTALATLILTGLVEIWHIAALMALFGAAEAFFRPAYTGLIPQTVPEALIQPAKAATATLDTLASFAGPALATALVFGVGGGWAFAVDAATFLVSAALIVRMRPRPRGAVQAGESLLVDLREGWGAVRSRAWVWVTISVFSLAIVCSFAPWQTLGPTVARDLYDNRALYGILTAVEGAGTVVGALIGFRWRPRHPLRAGFLLSLLWPVSALLFAAHAPLPLVFLSFALAGVGIALFIVWWETAMAEQIPPHLLSRVSSYDWMGSLALLPFGYLAAGPLGEALGGVEVLAAGAAIALVAQACGLLVRETRYLVSPSHAANPTRRAAGDVT